MLQILLLPLLTRCVGIKNNYGHFRLSVQI